MKTSVLTLIASVLLLAASASLSAGPAPMQIAAADSDASSQSAAKEPGSSGKQDPAPKKKSKPFTPEDLKKGEANKKKLEWWEMPKVPVFQSWGSHGGGHGGH
ncbi:MAG: hypothetical protein ACU843_16490 [Gammaproteobacteria bacterium]